MNKSLKRNYKKPWEDIRFYEVNCPGEGRVTCPAELMLSQVDSERNIGNRAWERPG